MNGNHILKWKFYRTFFLLGPKDYRNWNFGFWFWNFGKSARSLAESSANLSRLPASILETGTRSASAGARAGSGSPCPCSWPWTTTSATKLRDPIPNLTPILQPNHQTLDGSFSSASKPIFAPKYVFCSIFRELQDLQSFAPLQFQDWVHFRETFSYLCPKLLKNRSATIFIEFWILHRFYWTFIGI